MNQNKLQVSGQFLHSFTVVAKHMSFTKAAEDLCITQSAVSHRIRCLEQELGFPPFHRLTRKIILTEEGKTLYGALDASLKQIHETIRNIQEAELQGDLVIACAPSIAGCWLLPLLPEFQHEHPNISLHIRSGNDLISRVLYSAMERLGTLRIADLRGGQFDNVICTRCDAVVAVPAGKAEDFAAFIREFDGILKNEYAATDGDVALTCAAADADAAYSAEDSSRLLHVLLTLPQGVEVMSADFPGLVQTSLNLGVMTACGDGLHFSFSIRSSVATQKELLLQRVRAIVEYTGGGTVSTRGDYPAWQYARQSPLRDTVMASYKQITGQDGVIMATHGGLECGLLINKMPGLDAVSLGPELHDIHSPRERLGVDSVKRMYALVCEVLKNCR